jgi:hypothetical protein
MVCAYDAEASKNIQDNLGEKTIVLFEQPYYPEFFCI